MIPRIPMRGLRWVMDKTSWNGWQRAGAAGWSALTVVIFVSPMERVYLVGRQWFRRAEHPGEVHGAGHVLAHHRRLDRVTCGRSHGEHAVAAHQHGRRAVAGQRGNDSARPGSRRRTRRPSP